MRIKRSAVKFIFALAILRSATGLAPTAPAAQQTPTQAASRPPAIEELLQRGCGTATA